MQKQRFECKYLVPRAEGEQIRHVLTQAMVLDAFCREQVDGYYLISSLYLDDENCTLYRGTAEGLMNRFKLRIRAYDEDPESPVFFEVKRRLDGVIRKQRAPVRRTSVAHLLAGRVPQADDLTRFSDKGLAALQSFTEKMMKLNARPVCLVRYKRQAFTLPGNESLRVTLDWDLETQACADAEVKVNGPSWRQADMGTPWEPTILEIKFTDSYPVWVHELVRRFNLRRTSVPKYILSLDTLGLSPARKPPQGRLIV